MSSPQNPECDPGARRSTSTQRRGGPWLVLGAATAPFVALLALFIFDVPIGQPFFLIYRYSPFALLRIIRALPALAIGLGAVAFLYRSVRGDSSRLTSRTLLALLFSYFCLVGWTFVGPPSFVDQHAFNLLSPSHDGAFFIEARKIGSVRDYVGHDFYARLEKTPEEMRGRRILSNPPGATIAAVAALRTVESAPRLRRMLIALFGLAELDDTQQQTEFAAALLLGLLLTAALGAAILPAYWSCRLALPQTASICVAVAIVFNPATVVFTPGKDPAQLLTAVLILAGWLAGYLRQRASGGIVAGAALVLGTMVGLIHVWIFAIVAVATFAHAVWSRSDLRDWCLYGALPSLAAAAALAVAAEWTLGWNVLRMFQAVASRYGEIQLPIITTPFYWTLIGLPMFLLFVGSLFWAQLLSLHEIVVDRIAALGRSLLGCSIAVMAYGYFFANNSETPRLWIPFIPLLLLGMALRRSALREDSSANRRVLVLLVAVQIATTLACWTLMDARESEWRLLTGRLWD